jgi:hypothetical protein
MQPVRSDNQIEATRARALELNLNGVVVFVKIGNLIVKQRLSAFAGLLEEQP